MMRTEVADRDTFLSRFHNRTGGILRDIDWTHVRALGGMVVGCLVADERHFLRAYKGLDVDLFCVGVSEEGFKECVADVAKDIVAAAARENIKATLVWTPLTLTFNMRSYDDTPLPNVQIVRFPFENTSHLVFTSAEDCTAIAFDGQRLLAAPRAQEAIASRQNLVRPEKYHIRSYWSTEARLCSRLPRRRFGPAAAYDLGEAHPDGGDFAAEHGSHPSSLAPRPALAPCVKGSHQQSQGLWAVGCGAAPARTTA